MPEVQLFMDDPEKSVILGLPPRTAAIANPFYHATELERQGDRKGAERIYLELLNSYFDNSVVLAALGMNYAVAEKNGLAHTLLQRSLERLPNMLDDFKTLGILPKADHVGQLGAFLNGKKSELMNAIGTCYKHENKTDTARQYFEQAQTLIPTNPDIQNNLGTLYINEGHPEKARRHLNQALQVDPNHAQAHWNYSLCHLEQGEYEQGWKEYDWGMQAKVRMERNYTKDPLPMWDGSPGKTVVVYGEQGIGDEIMFASIIPDLMKDCKQVVVDCHKKLHTLFANSFPSLDIYPTREDMVITWPMKADGSLRYALDAKIAIGSLGRYYRNKLDAFPGTPYLKPTAKSELYWNEKLAAQFPDRKPKIGIHWIGGHKKTRVEVRSIDLEKLLPILKQDAHFISLQYTPAEEEIAQLKAKHGIEITHWPEACYSPNYDDTAGLVSNLDLVITVCTSVVHLAGSLGVPTWVLTPSRPAWRYRLDLDTMPWYGKTVTLFRQAPDTTDWGPVIEEVSANLEAMLVATSFDKTAALSNGA